jgi:hypothetical protein
MRFAVLGLDELRHRLTVSDYIKIGGVRGLISRYIEREVRRVAGNKALALILFPLLERLVTPDGESTAPLSQDELLQLVVKHRVDNIVRLLRELEDRDIVRRVLDPDGTIFWRLDHDYLAAPVREISRRQLPEHWELKDRLQRFDAAPLWQKPVKLGNPLALLRFTRACLLKGLRFGPATSWFCYSLGAFFFSMAVLTYTALEVHSRIVERDLGRTLFSSFSSEQRGGTFPSEAKALLELSAAPLQTRREFLATSLESGENARRLINHQFALATALSQTHTIVANELYQEVIRPVFRNRESEPTAVVGSIGLLHFWGTADLLSVSETQELPITLVKRMSQEKDYGALFALNAELSELKDKIEPATAQQLATMASERMRQEKELALFGGPQQVLDAIKDKIDRPTAQQLATELVERITLEKNPYALHSLATGLAALKDKIDPAIPQMAATTMVGLMRQEKNADALRSLAAGLDALKDKIDFATAQTLATNLVDAMKQAKDAGPFQGLAQGLGALKDKIDLATAQSLATDLAQQMMQEQNLALFAGLTQGLRTLREKMNPATAKKLATNITERMGKEKDPLSLNTLADGLDLVKDNVEPLTEQSLATELAERMIQEKKLSARYNLAHAMRPLNVKLSPAIAERAVTTLLDRISNAEDSNTRASLSEELGSLESKVDPATAGRLMTRFAEGTSRGEDPTFLYWWFGVGPVNVDPTIRQILTIKLTKRIRQDKDLVSVLALVRLLGLLKDEIDPTIAQELATNVAERVMEDKDLAPLDGLTPALDVLKDKIDATTARKLAVSLAGRMGRETAPNNFRSLAVGLDALKDNIDPGIYQTTVTTIAERITHEERPSALQSLAVGLGALKDKIDRATAQKLATKVVEQMKQAEDSASIWALGEGLEVLKDKINPATAQTLATDLAERMKKEKDPSVLRSVAQGMEEFPSAGLSQEMLPDISEVFRLPEGPCAILQVFDRSTQMAEVPKQLKNPLCAENDWKRLALMASQISGRPIARMSKINDRESNIVVEFNKLSEYVWSDQHWYNQVELSSYELAASILFATALCCFAFGLVVASRTRSC